MQMDNVRHFLGVQCSFGASAQKSTSLLTVGVDLADCPSKCVHARRPWFREVTWEAIVCTHPPSRGADRYFRTQPEALAATVNTKFVSAALAQYPP